MRVTVDANLTDAGLRKAFRDRRSWLPAYASSGKLPETIFPADCEVSGHRRFDSTTCAKAAGEARGGPLMAHSYDTGRSPQPKGMWPMSDAQAHHSRALTCSCWCLPVSRATRVSRHTKAAPSLCSSTCGLTTHGQDNHPRSRTCRSMSCLIPRSGSCWAARRARGASPARTMLR